MKNNVDFPKGFMKIMKDKKKNKIRNTPIEIDIIEQKFNDANRIL